MSNIQKITRMCTNAEVMNGFENAYDNIKVGEANKVRDAIMISCKWKTRSLFYMKKNGNRKLTPVEASIIKAIFKNNGINAATGAPI